MKIWDKLVFAGCAVMGVVLLAEGAYLCAVAHYPIGAIIILSTSGGIVSFSLNKLCARRSGYFECDYKEEENFKELVDKIIAQQQDQIPEKQEPQEPKPRKIRKKQERFVELPPVLQENVQENVNPLQNPVLNNAPLAYPIELQIVSNENKEGPYAHLENPFAFPLVTNENEKNK